VGKDYSMNYRSLILLTTLAAATPALADAPNPWQGFYAGGQVGYAFGASAYQTNPVAFPASGLVGLYGHDGQFGPAYGGYQAGYNFVTASRLLLGAEATFTFPDSMQSNLPLTFTGAGPSTVNDSVQIFGAIRGRVGYATDDWLFYGAGGFAYDRDLATSTDATGNADGVYIWRPGWTVGAGFELRLTRSWSAGLDYSFSDFAHANATFARSGDRYDSGLTLQTVRVGVNYHFGDQAEDGARQFGALSDPSQWSLHGQTTLIEMANAPFSAAYSGPSSLPTGFQQRDTLSATAFLGYKPWEGTEFYFNSEPFQGFGLTSTHGLAGFPNNEAQKAGYDFPHYYTARLFVRQTFGLGGEQEDLPDGQNQVAGKADISRVTVTSGKMSIPDIFDNNTYAHDARSSFMNYALVDAGAFDYAGDQKGYSWGSVVELNQKDWAIRTGYFLSGDAPNSNTYDTHVFERGQYLLETENRFSIFGAPAKLRLTAWDSQCFCGSFAATLADPVLSNPTLDASAPDVAATRKTRSEFGFIANYEQAVTDDLGVFARLSWQNGQTEIMQFADIDESATLGAVWKGTPWGRPDDRVGLAGVVNGLSKSYQAFLNAGGQGISIGDGALNYRPEQIIEAYYSIAVTNWGTLTFDYQFFANPADNAARGPVSFGAVRLHAQF
jgi:high affinity Mn2+ porin